MTRKSATRQAHLSRRTLLRTAGAAVGSGAITGFPTIWAQNIKDVVLRHAGPPVAAIPAIAEQASKDLGFTVQMQASENADLLNRFPVAVQRDRLRRRQPDVHAIFDRPGHSANHSGRQGGELGQDDSAVHQRRISRRPQSARGRARCR